MLLAALLVQAQRVPDIEAWRLESPRVQPCEGRTAPPPWPIHRDRTLDCAVLAFVVRIDQASIQAGPLALLIRGAHQDVAVDVNGIRIRDVAPLDHRSHTLTPLLLLLGSGLLAPGENEIRLTVQARPGSDTPVRMRAAFLGPLAPLAAVHARRTALQQGGARAALVLMVGILLFLVPIAVAGPPSPVLRWYALGIVAAAAYLMPFASPWRPVPAAVWDPLGFVALAAGLAAFVRLTDIDLGPGPRRWPWLACGAGALLIVVSLQLPGDGTSGRVAANVAGRVLLLLVVADLGLRWWRARGLLRTPDPRWYTGGVALLLACGIWDSLAALGVTAGLASAYLLHWGLLYVLLLVLATLVVRLLAALRDSERAQDHLSAALAARTRELTREFALRREAEAARTLAEERQRILRDMHDGVGGELVSLMAQARTGPIESALLVVKIQRTLDDLRLVVDSLDPACSDLSVALGMLRRRIGEGAAGAPAIEWRTAHLPDLPCVAPAVVLQVLRIVQEAVTNAIRHAQARRVVVEAAWSSGLLSIRVQDDGRGLAGAAPGRGLVHMRERAARLGARLAVTDLGPGVRVELVLAVPAAAAADADGRRTETYPEGPRAG